LLYWSYLFVLSVSFLCSLFRFRSHTPDLKIFSAFLGLTVITETLANIAIYYHWKTNYIVYNSFMLPEYCLYAAFFKSIIQDTRVQKALTGFMLIFPLIWIGTTLTLHISTWNSYAILIGDAATVGMCAAYLFEVFASEDASDLKTSSEFWITAATLMYCCCEIPITGRLNYLAVHHKKVTMWLEDVLQILNILMYLTITYAFLCRRPIITMRSLRITWWS
jgi:hypothetical protein